MNNLFARDDKIIFCLALFLKYIKKAKVIFFLFLAFHISIEDALQAIHPKYDIWREPPDVLLFRYIRERIFSFVVKG